MKADPEIGNDWTGRWKGRTVACIASGPSLTLEDCERVRAAGIPTIVTNTTYQRAPWADALFAFDGAWLKHYQRQVANGQWPKFAQRIVTCSTAAKVLGAEGLGRVPWFRPMGISGASAISLAITGQAACVILVGFDAKRSAGETHWHGDHPRELRNAVSMPQWWRHFKAVARYAREQRVQVLNCSRETAIGVFPVRKLEEVLC